MALTKMCFLPYNPFNRCWLDGLDGFPAYDVIPGMGLPKEKDMSRRMTRSLQRVVPVVVWQSALPAI